LLLGRKWSIINVKKHERENMKQTQKKMVLAGMLTAAAVLGGSFFSFPVGVARCAPAQHLVNVVAGVMLGPGWGCAAAFCAALLRVLLGTGSILAFPGSIPGALLAGLAFFYTRKISLAALGEVLGTGMIGSLLSSLTLRVFMGQEAAVFLFLPSFFASTLAGAVLAVAILKALQKSGGDLQFKLLFDGIFAAIKILDFLNLNNITMEQALGRLPAAHKREVEVNVANENKGRLIKELINQYRNQKIETTEGVKIYQNGGWVLVVPARDRGVCKIIAEGDSEEFAAELRRLEIAMITTTVHKNYLMFIKCAHKLPTSPMNRDEVTAAEIEIRNNMYQGLEAYRKYIPGFEKAFISRTSPSLAIRRGRSIECDYDLSNEQIINAVHFDDDVFVYGFHDSAPRFKVKNGGSYGFPYRAGCVKGVDNLYAIGMMVTSEHNAHMSTRNTVSCMAQGQSFGTAAAMCAAKNIGTRELPYKDLRAQLEADGVYFE